MTSVGEELANGVAVVERIARECFRSFSRLPGARLLDDGRVFGAMTRVPIQFFNGIATTDLTEDEVGPVLATLQEDGQPFRWWISPSTRPAGLADILVRMGLRHTYDADGMAVDLAFVDFGQPLPHDLSIRRVDVMDPWVSVFMEGFDRPSSEAELWTTLYPQCPEWTHFVGYLRGVPIATTSLLMCGDLAGIYHVVTLPAARGRGVGKAITTEALRYARAMGARRAALQSSEMGFNVYRAIGFVPYCKLTLYDWRP